jgi:lysine 2,3-aminomutase
MPQLRPRCDEETEPYHGSGARHHAPLATPDLAGVATSLVAVPRRRAEELAPLEHRRLDESEFWRRIPAFEDVSAEQFLDLHWQNRHTVTKLDQLLERVGELVPPRFADDVREGLARAPMALRISPYLLSRIEWERPWTDPIRSQFIPVASRMLDDHPSLTFDSLAERRDSPVPGLTHRYPDKALFVALDTCPVYCCFCTRSYAVGLDTARVDKLRLTPNRGRWEQMFAYIAGRPELEDIVVSGGDAYNLRPDHVRLIGTTLLAMPNIRRIRFATKGPVVCPMKLLSDHAWVDALTEVVERGRKMHKQVVLHTHFNHPDEITGITRDALAVLFERGITMRSQSVLQRGINDDAATLGLLIRRLGYVNVQPYYVYVHDLVKGVEGLRTTLDTALRLEKEVRGLTAGYNTPLFVVDTPGGGGKRDAHSYEHYDRELGVSVYRSPNVDPEALYLYFDPIHLLPAAGRRRWADTREHGAIVEEVRAAARRACRR